MSWECRECHSINSDDVLKCVCGYEVIESVENEKIERKLREHKTNWKRALLEAAILFIAIQIPTFVMGFFFGKIGPIDDIGQINFKLKFYYAAIAMELIGFIVIGCLHKKKRFNHLFAVALILWGFGFIDYLFKPFSIGSMASRFFHVMIAMMVGGGISLLFVRQK